MRFKSIILYKLYIQSSYYQLNFCYYEILYLKS